VELDAFALEEVDAEADFLECDASVVRDDLAWSSSADELE